MIEKTTSGPTDERRDIEIICVGGSGRSGSTLIGQILGSPDGHAVVGELGSIWQRGMVENRRCDCGEPFDECPFWTDVVTRAWGGRDQVDVERVLRLTHATQGASHLPMLLVPALRTRRFRRDLAEYVGTLTKLIDAIDASTGGKVLVDSSKSPSHFLSLMELDGIRLRLVHLVRDSRAIAWSWQRKKLRIDVPETTRYMAQHPPAKVAAHWMHDQLYTDVIRRRFHTSTRIRYEDFAERPRTTMGRTLRDIAVSGDVRLPFTTDDTIELPTDHAVWGNPSRFAQGAVVITPDAEWRTKLRRVDRVLVTVLTAPLLLRHGYLRRR